MSDLVGNPEDRFSCKAAQISYEFFFVFTHFSTADFHLGQKTGMLAYFGINFDLNLDCIEYFGCMCIKI